MTSTIIPTWELKDRCIKAREVGGFKRQDDLAEASGGTLTVRTISRYESGETRKPTRSIIAQWALACGVPFDWLMYGTLDLREGDATPRYAHLGADLPIGDVLAGVRAS